MRWSGAFPFLCESSLRSSLARSSLCYSRCYLYGLFSGNGLDWLRDRGERMQIAHLQRLISKKKGRERGEGHWKQREFARITHVHGWLEWVSSFSIPSRCCFPVVPATSVATLATTLVSRGQDPTGYGNRICWRTDIEVCSSTERLCYNCMWALLVLCETNS